MCSFVVRVVAFLFAVLFICLISVAQQPPPARPDTSRGDMMLADYFAAETKKIQDACLADIKTLADWKAKRAEYRRQLHEMLGLDPLPEKTDLKPVITGRLEAEDFVVEKLHFQSRPGLYVTSNLYLPKKIEKPLPTILYVCGHSRVLGPDGKTPMGAKAGYQHHGAWYARNGYACLTIDTLQLGEIEGIHHGTHRYGMWWWLNRGYTPAGVEAWNCVRALDYLETRPEIDKDRFGVTGRSGGGAYSWWIAAIDDRIKVAVPTAGITDLRNHVVDGTVEGHCDCMFMVNTYRWDYPQVAALVAPRPLLISNTDSDGIFPLDGVVRTFDKVRRIYRLFDSEKRGTSADIALNISPGPHKDTQELNTHEFRWFNHYLKNDDSPIDSRAPKYFQPEQLKVFDKLPADEINTKIHETFVAKEGLPSVPHDEAQWKTIRNGWLQKLREFSVRDWKDDRFDPDTPGTIGGDVFLERQNPFDVHEPEKIAEKVQDGIKFIELRVGTLPLYVLQRVDLKPELHVLTVLDEQGHEEFSRTIGSIFERGQSPDALSKADREKWDTTKKMLNNFPWGMSYFCPRGLGSTSWDPSERKQVQNRRRFYLLGQTLDEAQVHDVRRAIQLVFYYQNPFVGRWADGTRMVSTPLWVQSHRKMAAITLYASLFERDIKRLDLYDLPKSHRDGPFFLNVERYLDMPEALAIAAERSKIVLYQDDDTGWEYPQQVANALHWPENQIQIRRKPAKD